MFFLAFLGILSHSASSVRLFDVIKLARTTLDADVEVVGCKGRDYILGNRNS